MQVGEGRGGGVHTQGIGLGPARGGAIESLEGPGVKDLTSGQLNHLAPTLGRRRINWCSLEGSEEAIGGWVQSLMTS